ncbi:vWA domain-containing protein [Mycolicibacterium alvei]
MMQVREFTPAERRAFQVARLVASEQMPYFSSGLFSMIAVAAPGLGTLGVDKHWRLYADPACLIGETAWTPREAGAVLLHELGHLLREHAARGEAMPQPLAFDAWNLAGDAEINDDLLAAGAELPEGVVTPEALGCEAGGTAEQYYEQMSRDHCDDDSVGCGSGSGAAALPGELDPAHVMDGRAGIDQATADVIRRAVAQRVSDEVANGRGTVPAGVRRWADNVLAPPAVSWERLLAKAVRSAIADAEGRTDYTYQRPSRRRLPGVVLPSMRGPRVSVSLVIDTSGSMTSSDLSAALSEVNGVLKTSTVARDQLRVYTCDADSTAAQRVNRVSDIVLTGGGGTDMRVGIAAAHEAHPAPHVVVVLTDGDTPWPDVPTRARLVCVVIGNPAAATRTPPWAITVDVPTAAQRA